MHPLYHRTNYYPRLGMSIVGVPELNSLQQVGGGLLLDSIDVAKLWAVDVLLWYYVRGNVPCNECSRDGKLSSINCLVFL